MIGKLFTDKLVCWISEVPRGWSLDSATPSESAYPAHVGGSPVKVIPPDWWMF